MFISQDDYIDNTSAQTTGHKKVLRVAHIKPSRTWAVNLLFGKNSGGMFPSKFRIKGGIQNSTHYNQRERIGKK